MADIAITRLDTFPEGTEVGAYPLTRWPNGIPDTSAAPPGISEQQVVTVTGSPTGGDFTLTFAGQTTAAIAYNASAATVKTRLTDLSNIGADDVTVTGSAGGPWTVTFAGSLATDVAQMTASGAGLTGGTAPAVNVTTSVAGVGYAALETMADDGLTFTGLDDGPYVAAASVGGTWRYVNFYAGADQANAIPLARLDRSGASEGDVLTMGADEPEWAAP